MIQLRMIPRHRKRGGAGRSFHLKWPEHRDPREGDVAVFGNTREHFSLDELSVFPETVSYSRLRWLLGITMTATIAGTRLSAIRLSRMSGRYGAGFLVMRSHGVVGEKERPGVPGTYCAGM